MLQKFRVSNFKSFNKDFELDLTNTNGYAFNKSAIKNNIVNNAIIYGENGVGKSNLALAIFDIIEHLTDKNRNESIYKNYLNAYNGADVACFYYEFLINSKIITYEYRKADYETIIYERFAIDGVDFILFDRKKDTNALIKFEGAESLKTEITNPELSVLKYVKNNTDLKINDINVTFSEFFYFIDNMLFFRSLTDRKYLGFEVGSRDILEDIVKKGNLKDFETFLNSAKIECKLSAVTDLSGQQTIVFDFEGKQYPFSEVASTGTSTLCLFYYWYQNLKESTKVPFVFIDEFDAFYHHSLSRLIVEKLKETGVQFILTTHNTSIMSNDLLRPDCYFLMDKKQIKSLSNCTKKELREAHNLEKMYKASSFRNDEE
ncbi:MAG: ATP-binding protein [Flavobacteriaceae bacterium]|nr:ATP-binding protein [Flavobacteriaceae bacterium]